MKSKLFTSLVLGIIFCTSIIPFSKAIMPSPLEIEFYPCDCQPVHYAFTAISEFEITSWNWSFGDGYYSHEESPTHSYASAGEYTVCLIAVFENGDSLMKCETQYMEQGYVPTCEASFTYSETWCGWCGPNTYQFFNNSVGENLSYYWDFSDGTIAYDAEPSHSFADDGYYDVCLTIQSSDSCNDTYCDTIIIGNPYPQCEADFSYYLDSTANCLYCYQFNDASSFDAILWNWDFGDGYSSNLQNPVHTYQNAGVYSVELIITTSDGCISSTYKTVKVGIPDPCDIEISYDILESFPVQYDFYFNMDNLDEYIFWEISDGTISDEPSLRHTFEITGVYTVCVTVINIMGDTCKSCITEHFEGRYEPYECSEFGTVLDYSGIDGCGFVIELDTGYIIEPAVMPFDDNFEFYHGQRVKLSYNRIRLATTCMVGIVAEITCIEEIPSFKHIESIQLIPEIPIANQEIEVLVNTIFPSGGCDLIDYSVRREGNDIFVLAFHELGEAAYICHSTDFVTLGEFPAGNYTLYYQLVIGVTTSAIAETYVLNFTVEDTIYYGPAGPDKTICPDDSTMIGEPTILMVDCMGFADCIIPGSFYWEPSTGLSDANSVVTMASPESTTTYYLYYTSLELSRPPELIDSVTVFVTIPYFEYEKQQIMCFAPPCPDEYLFMDKSEGNILYREWSFGNGTYSTEKNPYAFYMDSGLYQVCLTTYAENNCQQTYCRSIYVNLNNIPTTCDGNILLTTSTIIGGDSCSATASAKLIDDYYGEEKAVKKYQWSTGETSEQITNLCANTLYSLTVTDYDNCKYYTTFSFAEIYENNLTLIYINYELIDGVYYFTLTYSNEMLIAVWDFGDGNVFTGSSVSYPKSDDLKFVNVKLIDNLGNVYYENTIELDDGITEIDDQVISDNIMVYPNPTENILNILLPYDVTNVKFISIYNSLGQQVFIHELNEAYNHEIYIDVSQLQLGYYIGQLVTNDNELKQFKFMKIK